MTYSKNIRFLRKSAKLSQEELAEILGVKRHTICDWETERTEPSISQLKAVAEAFNVSLDKMVVMPLPTVDLICNPKYIKANKKKVLDKYPNIKDKKVILYAPTFRKNKDMTKDIQNLINEVDFDKYNLVIKLHPLSKTIIKDKRVIFDKKFTTIEMAVISDYVITDYSAVVFEIALLNKPIYFYAYDRETYINDRDFYIDYDRDMPGVISERPEDIFEAIENDKYDLKIIKKFANDYIAKVYGGYTANVVNFILNLKK